MGYNPDGQKILKLWYKDGIKHRLCGPVVIKYYDDGAIKEEEFIYEAVILEWMHVQILLLTTTMDRSSISDKPPCGVIWKRVEMNIETFWVVILKVLRHGVRMCHMNDVLMLNRKYQCVLSSRSWID